MILEKLEKITRRAGEWCGEQTEQRKSVTQQSGSWSKSGQSGDKSQVKSIKPWHTLSCVDMEMVPVAPVPSAVTVGLGAPEASVSVAPDSQVLDGGASDWLILSLRQLEEYLSGSFNSDG